MDIVAWIVWGIKLDDPIYFWNIKTSRCDVGTYKDAGVCIAEFEERVCSFLLFLLALEKSLMAALYNEKRWLHGGRERGSRYSSVARRGT